MNISFGEQPPLFWAGIADAGNAAATCSRPHATQNRAPGVIGCPQWMQFIG